MEVTLSDLESQYGGTPLRVYSSSLGTLDPKQNGVKKDYTVSLLKNARGGGPDGARLARRAIGILCRFVVTAARRTRNAQCGDRRCTLSPPLLSRVFSGDDPMDASSTVAAGSSQDFDTVPLPAPAQLAKPHCSLNHALNTHSTHSSVRDRISRRYWSAT